VTAGFDPLRDEGKAYRKILDTATRAVVLRGGLAAASAAWRRLMMTITTFDLPSRVSPLTITP
jgi:hypothetical protein